MTEANAPARAGAVLAALGIVLGGTACAPSRTTPRIQKVEPAQAYGDSKVILQIEVADLRASLHVDVDDGTLTTDALAVRMALQPGPPASGPAVPLKSLGWNGDQTFWAQAPPNLSAGSYTLTVTTPDGQHVTLPNAFQALGPDMDPPTLTLDPVLADSVVAEGTTKVTSVVADDGFGAVAQIHWETDDQTSGDCFAVRSSGTDVPPVVPPSRLTCPVSFSIPKFAADAPPDLLTKPFGFHAWATDTAGNPTPPLDISLQFARLPSILTFAGKVGALGGFQPFEVQGDYFLPGSQVLLDGVPIVGKVPGGDQASDHLIVGWTPPRNRAGAVQVQVRSEAGTTSDAVDYFKYVAPPNPREVQPTRGPSAGGIRITVKGNDLRPNAIIYMGATRETRQQLKYPLYTDAANKIEACLPQGSGTVSIWVYDAITGDGNLPMAFTYDDTYDATTSPLDPGCL